MNDQELVWQLGTLFTDAVDSGMAPEEVRSIALGYIEGRQWVAEDN
jgi:hypothetical protein